MQDDDIRCVMHYDDAPLSDSEVKPFTKKRWKTFTACAKQWNDLDAECHEQRLANASRHLLECKYDTLYESYYDTDNVALEGLEQIGYHTTCYRRFIDKRRLEFARKKIKTRAKPETEDGDQPKPSPKKSKLRSASTFPVISSHSTQTRGRVLPKVCIICKKLDHYVNRKRDRLCLAETKAAGNQVQNVYYLLT